MTSTLTPAKPADFERVGPFKRPKVILPDGSGKTALYTRATTYVDCVEDKYALQQWQLRQALTGIGLKQQLVTRIAVAAANEDRDELDRLVAEALQAAGSKDAAATGTTLHSLTEMVDRGQALPQLPDEVHRDLKAYTEATADLKVLHIEQQLVLDTLQIAGTTDRIVSYEGERYIADLKTGGITYGTGKIAGQLAIYARSHLYDVATGARDVHGASTTRGIIIHMRPGSGECELHWVDLEAGWAYVKLAEQIRAKRKQKFEDLTAPFGPPARPSLHREKAAESKVEQRADGSIERAIAGAKTGDELREVWAEFVTRGEWKDPEHTDAAKARLAEIELGAQQTSTEAQA
jgi:hypothetical protein